MSTNKKRRERKKKQRVEDLPLPSRQKLDFFAQSLAREIDQEIFRKKCAPVASVLKLVGAGDFFTASAALPNLPKALQPFLSQPSGYEVWKRFNVPYLKRTLKRLEKQKLVEIFEKNNKQVVKITDSGRRRILRYALDELEIQKPATWDSRWRLISYDLPEKFTFQRDIFRNYLKAWGFCPIHDSVFLHAYPCEKEVEFLREYLGIGEYVRIFRVSAIERDKVFRDFFGV